MKPSTKEKIKEALFEIVGELVLCAVGFGIGYGVLYLLGIEDRVLALDPELLVLIGFLALAVLCLGVWVLVRLFRHRRAHGEQDAPDALPSEEGGETPPDV